MADVKFEDALKKLQNIVEHLEKGDISLDESLAKYEEGVKLAKLCQKKLDEAREKIEILVKSKDGKMKLEPFAQDTAKKKKKAQEKSLF